MARAPLPSNEPAPRNAPWRRTRRRPWAQPGDVDAAAWLFGAIPSLPRAELERLAERVIETMDDLDGDPDLEDDDPAGGNVEDEGEPEDWRSDGIEADRPVYVEDQSLGPINQSHAVRNFERKRLSLWGRP